MTVVAWRGYPQHGLTIGPKEVVDPGHRRSGGATVPETWGERLQRLREARGMSRQELTVAVVKLGRRTEVGNIRRYEEGDYWPRLLTFAALARVLGVSIETLLYGEEEAARIARERALDP